jgi:hypothetical protein
MKRFAIIFLLFGLASLIQGQDDTTWYWRQGDDPDSVKRTRGELDSLLESHSKWIRDTLSGKQLTLLEARLDRANLEGTNLQGANLENARLWDANLKRADLSRAHLEGADLRKAHLEGADLWGAHLERSNLRKAHLERSNLGAAYLEDAYLGRTHLEGADLMHAHLEGAHLGKAHLEDAIFEPNSLPKIWGIARAYGLSKLKYIDDPSMLVALREEFAKNGFKQSVREIICALRRHEAHFLAYIFLDLTSEYGSNLSMPWYILSVIWLICSLIYYKSMRKKSNSGVSLITDPSNIDGINSLGDYITRIDSGIKTLIYRDNPVIIQHIKDCYIKTPMPIRLIWWALFFSTMSAFNIGFRDINFGRWLRLIPRREFDLKPFGWIRTVSGLQALSSVYLIGLWILSFAGTPFK